LLFKWSSVFTVKEYSPRRHRVRRGFIYDDIFIRFSLRPPRLCGWPHGSLKALFKEQLLILLGLVRKSLLVEILCLHRLYLVGVRKRRTDSLAVDELTHLGQDSHAFIAEEKIDKCLTAIRMLSSVAEREILADAQHLAEPDPIHRRAFLAVGDDIPYEADGDGRLAGRDALSGRRKGLHQKRFRRAQVADELVRLFPAHDLVQAPEPLDRGRVLCRVGHH